MLKSTSLPGRLRALSTGQWLLLIAISLVVIFIILGSLLQPATPNEFAFGIQTQPFIVLAVLAFFAGLLSFVSPCTLPVLTAYFAFAFQSERQRIATNTMAFMLGLATTFSILGAVGFAVGRVLLQNQQLLLLVGGSIILIFGVMSLLGMGFGGVKQAGGHQFGATVGGSYLFGLTFAVGWSSCVGPILGSVLTLAAQTSSVWRGMMLLFIYTIGLGLPLLIVSTFFGRMSRQSLFWRALKGKGWDWDTHVFVVALVWALAIWRIMVASFEYALRNFSFMGNFQLTLGVQIGLLALAVVGAALWVFTSSENRRITVRLHTTQLISGALFILMGVLMLEAQLAYFNNIIPPSLAEWLAVQEERLIGLFTR
ncbi:MAG: cytochrome c biogenesis protein CcdA [Chloroflexi bacterium]|nr:cytochrome c biogenesis protein CcdA [Chloroflexota bacterium]MBP7045273.1 cytochrome c biogenesis protein CcdA [Chloroflexota bacterium]